MTGKTIKCNNCAGSLDVTEGVNKIFCLYCGTPNLLTDILEIPGVGLKCLSCGARNKDEAIFCTKCGANLQKKCPLCKETHTNDTVYCPKTGRNIKKHEKELEEHEKKRQRELEESMVLISGGTFLMGSKFADAMPIHSVTVNSYYIGKYPVTNKEYRLYDSSHDNSRDNLPVVNVSWNDAVKYCKWLSSKTGNNYRLPTEAEWEYACRAGSNTEYYWGNKMNDSYCWHKDNSGNKIHPVGQKIANKFGIYDISGNLWEWCNDWYGYYTSDSISNPIGPSSGSTRIYRGGSWNSHAESCRSAYRNSNSPDNRNDLIGFRTVCNSKMEKEHIKLHSSQVNVEAPVKIGDPKFLKIVRQGDDLVKQNQYDSAIAIYQRALRMDPHSSDVRRKLIDMCKNKGAYREAVAEYINWAEVCKRDGNYDEAIEIFQECLNLEKREVKQKKSPFFVRTPTEDLGQVRDALTEYGYEIHWKLGLVYLVKGNLSDAVAEFKKSIEMNPANPAEIHKHLGLIYTELEKYNEAIGEYQEVLRLTPDDASVYEQLGDICYKHHKDTSAIHFFSLAAEIYLKKNEVKEATRVYENILKIEPENIDILTKLSEIYANDRQVNKAIDPEMVYIEGGTFQMDSNNSDEKPIHSVIASSLNIIYNGEPIKLCDENSCEWIDYQIFRNTIIKRIYEEMIVKFKAIFRLDIKKNNVIVNIDWYSNKFNDDLFEYDFEAIKNSVKETFLFSGIISREDKLLRNDGEDFIEIRKYGNINDSDSEDKVETDKFIVNILFNDYELVN